MPITSIKRDETNNVSIVRITTTDTLADVAATDYILDETPNINALNNGFWQWFSTDVLLVSCSDSNAFFQFTDSSFSSLVLIASTTDGTVSPGLINQVAYYPASGTVIAGTYDLPAPVQIHPENVNNGLNASATTFFAGNDTWKTVASATNHSQFTVYVAPDGNDVTGNGSINAPYQTITHALTTITTASSATPFVIVCQEGVYSETALALKPFVSVNGQNSILILSGTITADPLWNGGGIMFFSNFSQLTVGAIVSFDVSSAGTNQCIIQFQNIQFTSPLTFGVIGATNCIVILSQLFSYSGALDLNVTNAYGAFSECSFTNCSYTANDPAANYVFQLIESGVSGNLIVASVAPSGVNFIIKNSFIIGTASASGANTALNTTVDSLTQTSLPNLIGGATASYFNVANTLEANYTPVNYTPDASGTTPPVTSVAAHLHGIDNALGTALGSSNNNVYVYENGSDLTGDGSFTKPFATVAHAMTTITTASPTNPITVVISGRIVETAQILLKPNVSIASISPDSLLDVSFADMVLDTTYISSTDTSVAFFNDFSVSGTFDFDLSTRVVAGARQFTFSNVQIDTNLTISGCASSFGFVQIQNGSSAAAVTVNNINVVACINAPLSNVICGNIPGVRTTVTFFVGCTIFNADLQADGFLNTYTILGTQITGTLTVTDTLSTLNIDVASYIPPILVSGPTVNLTSITNGLSANHTAVNYTPVATPPDLATSMHAHLVGIDNKLGTVTNQVLTWNEVSGTSQAAAVNNAYITNNGGLVTVTLPATAAIGDRIAIQGKGAGGWSLVANTGQSIILGNQTTSVAGSLSSTHRSDTVEVVCITANTTWASRFVIGTLTVA